MLLTTPEDWKTWTKGTIEQAQALIKPIAANRLLIVQEGKGPIYWQPSQVKSDNTFVRAAGALQCNCCLRKAASHEAQYAGVTLAISDGKVTQQTGVLVCICQSRDIVH